MNAAASRLQAVPAPSRTRWFLILLAVAAAALVSACSSLTAKKADRIMLVDSSGARVPGATVLPEDEDIRTNTPRLSPDDPAQVSDANGMVRADIEQYLWEADGCYHFRITRPGFEPMTMSVSKELCPPVLTIKLDSIPRAQGAVPNAGRP
jgi:hypothetical protein